MGVLDSMRARAHAALERVPGKAGDAVRKANDALGRPLADEARARRPAAFETQTAPRRGREAGAGARRRSEAAPVIVYHMDKTRRDAQKLTDILDANGVTYKVTNIQEDPAAQYAVRRDSQRRAAAGRVHRGRVPRRARGARQRGELGELKKKVFGA